MRKAQRTHYPKRGHGTQSARDTKKRRHRVHEANRRRNEREAKA